MRNEVLSEAEAHQTKFAATANWQGGYGKNIEIDLFQENKNRDIKEMISRWGQTNLIKLLAGQVKHQVA